MGWTTIRKATRGDEQTLQHVAERLCKRHNIEFDSDFSALTAIEYTLDSDRDNHAQHLRPLWRKIVRRALGHPHAEGIAWGYVGYSRD